MDFLHNYIEWHAFGCIVVYQISTADYDTVYSAALQQNLHISKMRKLSFFTVPFWFDTFFVCGRPGLCVVLGCGASVGRYVNLVLLLLSISLFIHDFTVLARQVLIQRSSSSRAHSKRVTNKTIFDVYVPLIVHVLLLTHEFMNDNICLPHSWHPK